MSKLDTIEQAITLYTAEGLRAVPEIQRDGEDFRPIIKWSQLNANGWNPTEVTQQTESALKSPYLKGVSLITGANVQGDRAGQTLVVIDIDSKSGAGCGTPEARSALADKLQSAADDKLQALGYSTLLKSMYRERTKTQGAHLWFFLAAGVDPDIVGKALYYEQGADGNPVTITEIFKEKHLCRTYPTIGYTPYPDSPATIADAPTLTAAEYRAVVDSFKSDYQPQPRTAERVQYTAPDYVQIGQGGRDDVFAEYNHNQTLIMEELERAGYSIGAVKDEGGGKRIITMCHPKTQDTKSTNISVIQYPDGGTTLTCYTNKIPEHFAKDEVVPTAANIYARLHHIPDNSPALFEALARSLGRWEEKEDYINRKNEERMKEFVGFLEKDEAATGGVQKPAPATQSAAELTPKERAMEEARESQRRSLKRLDLRLTKALAADSTDPDTLKKRMDYLSSYGADLIKPQTYEEFLYSRIAMGNAVPTGIYIQGEEWTLRSGSINFYVAPTGHGKTTLLLNVAMNVVMNDPNARVMFITLEEDRTFITDYALNIYLGKADPATFRDYTIAASFKNSDDSNRSTIAEYYPNAKHDFQPEVIAPDKLAAFERLQEQFAREYLESGRLLIRYLPSEEVHTLVAGIKIATDELTRSGEGVTLIVMDYIQLLGVDDALANARNEQVKTACQLFMEFGAGMGIPILSGSQFNREVQSWEDLDNTKMSESSDIEKVATSVVGGYSFAGVDEETLRGGGKKQGKSASKGAGAGERQRTPGGLGMPDRNNILLKVMKNRMGRVGGYEYINVSRATQALYYDRSKCSKATAAELDMVERQAEIDDHLKAEAMQKGEAPTQSAAGTLINLDKVKRGGTRTPQEAGL